MSRAPRQPGPPKPSLLRRVAAWPMGVARWIGRKIMTVAPVRWLWRQAGRVVGAPVRSVVRVFLPAPKVLRPYRADPLSMSRRIRRTTLVLFLALFCFIYGAAFALLGQAIMVLFALPVALLALAVIWALPDMPNAPTGLLNGFFTAFFIALVIWPNYLALSLPGLPWITSQRLTAFPMVGLFLICLSVSRRFREELGRCLAATPLIWRLLGLFVLLQTISLGFSSQASFSIQKYIIEQINWTIMYLVACWIFLKNGRLTFWAKAIWVMAVLESVIAMIEVKLGHVPWAGHIPTFLTIEDPSVLRTLSGAARAATGIHRAAATFGTPLGLGEYIALTMPFALHFVATSKDWRWKVAALLSVPVFFLDAFLSDSRLGMVGCMLSIILSLLGQAYFRWRRQREDMFAPALVLSFPVIALAAGGAVLGIGKLRKLVFGGGASAQSNQSRAEQWMLGLDKVKARPWGYGVERAADVLGYIAPGQDFLTIDSYFLELILDYGPLGFALYLTLMFATMGYAALWGVRPSAEDDEHGLLIPIAISLLNFVVIKAVFTQQDNHPLVYIMMGAVTALIYRAKKGLAVDADAVRAATSARAMFRWDDRTVTETRI